MSTLAPAHVHCRAARHAGRVTQPRVLPLGVDEAPLGALDALVAGRRVPVHDRRCRARRGRRLAPLAARPARSDRADFHPLEVSLVGVQLAQLAIGVLGVLVITAEYSTGMIRASMTAVPKRLPVLWAKAVVYAARRRSR